MTEQTKEQLRDGVDGLIENSGSKTILMNLDLIYNIVNALSDKALAGDKEYGLSCKQALTEHLNIFRVAILSGGESNTSDAITMYNVMIMCNLLAMTMRIMGESEESIALMWKEQSEFLDKAMELAEKRCANADNK